MKSMIFRTNFGFPASEKGFSGRSKNSGPLLGLLVAGAIISATGGAYAQPGGFGGPAAVDAAEVVRGPVFDELRLTGSVVPRRFSNLAAEVSGRVHEVLVDEGDLVAEGEVLLRMRTRPVELQVAAARAALAEETAALEELLNGTRPEDLAVAEAESKSARASLSLAEAERRRLDDLLADGVVSASEFDRIEAQELVASAEYNRRNALLERAKAGPREEEIAAAQARVDSARADLEILQDQLERHAIRAPFTSVVGVKSTEVGEWLSPGSPVFSLAELDPLRLEVALPERYYSRLRPGHEVSVRFDALPDRTYTEPVTVLVPLAGQQSRAFPVRIDLPNDDMALAPGMLGRATLLFPEEEERVLVPKDSIVMNPDRSRQIWLVVDGDEGSKAVSREVIVGPSFNGLTAILSGDIEAGDMVVTRGNEGLRPDQQVRILSLTRPEIDESQSPADVVDTVTVGANGQ